MTPFSEWLSRQPLAVRVLAGEFPFGSAVVFGDAVMFVVGWTSYREVIVSLADPG